MNIKGITQAGRIEEYKTHKIRSNYIWSPIATIEVGGCDLKWRNVLGGICEIVRCCVSSNAIEW